MAKTNLKQKQEILDKRTFDAVLVDYPLLASSLYDIYDKGIQRIAKIISGEDDELALKGIDRAIKISDYLNRIRMSLNDTGIDIVFDEAESTINAN